MIIMVAPVVVGAIAFAMTAPSQEFRRMGDQGVVRRMSCGIAVRRGVHL
jgi:hypothetical protein